VIKEEHAGTECWDLVQFLSELPEHVLRAKLSIKALHLSAPVGEEDCDFCRWAEDPDEDIPRPHQCEHYDQLEKAIDSIIKIEDSLAKEELSLIKRIDCLEVDAHLARLGAEIASTEALGENPNERLRPLWYTLPEGYFAVPDPRALEADEMTYWYRGQKGRKTKRHVFSPWPSGARYGPQLTSWEDVPYPKGSEEAKLYVRAFYKILGEPYRNAIEEIIHRDPVAAGQRFADWKTRCCFCGKALTNELSKVYGVGPECRKGLPAEVLANYYRPEVGKVHAGAV
jgi:hypothetical protein